MMNRWYQQLIFLLLIGVSSIAPIVSAAPATDNRIIIALDAGHGGKDPGAIGQKGLQEKSVNYAVVKKLYTLFERDPAFHPVFTRSGDYFILVSARSDIARSKNAHFLISIHADAAENNKAKGASVWVLSNKRADSELGRLLEKQEKQSELLGGGGDILDGEDNPYLSHAVIDLQFAHSQRVGYEVAKKVIKELGRIGTLHKRTPEHASFGILRSPDIPSVLVEVGFISNANEEKLLKSSDYQDKLAKAIYQGVKRYFQENPIATVVPNQPNQPKLSQPSPPTSSQTTKNGGTVNGRDRNSTKVVNSKSSAVKQTTTDRLPTQATAHVVKTNETLYSISRQYGVSVNQLSTLNKLKNNQIWVGQRLKLVANNTANSSHKTTSLPAKKHKVVVGDSLSSIAQTYRVSASAIKQMNSIKTDQVRLGQVLMIPQTN